MEKIDLNFISAYTSQSFLYLSTYEFVLGHLQDELNRINAYIEKYDNKYDKADGTCVESLKRDKEKILEKLEKLKSLKD